MPTLQVSAADAIGYDDAGRGPIVVLVHGSPGTSRAWQPVGGRLAARFRVIAPKLPGYGATTRPPGEAPGDSSHAARLIEALIAEVGPPAVLAGHSYGGVVALIVALRGRVKPRALALFEPVAVPVLAAVGEAEAFVAARALFERYCAAFDAGDREAVRIIIGALDRMPAPMREFLIAHTGHKCPRRARDVAGSVCRRCPSRALAMPVLCVCGARSPEVMVKIVEAIASHAPRGIIKKVEKADHAMTTTHPEAVAALIAELADGSA